MLITKIRVFVYLKKMKTDMGKKGKEKKLRGSG